MVLDNASNILSVERHKKTVTKLCVAQSLAKQACFGILVIDTKLHGGALDGHDVFRDPMPLLYEEYMFAPFFLTPLSEEQLKRIIREAIQRKLEKNFSYNEERR
jgi:hypothetical protein